MHVEETMDIREEMTRQFGAEKTGGHGGLEILKHIGPGLLVTVGFIDPGNWASNMAAGSQFGYGLLWVVTLSTLMLILLQHNAAHLGIATGECLAEATHKHFPRWLGTAILATAYAATVATAMAEVLGGAIALQMLFGLPVRVGSVIVGAFSVAMLATNSYKRIERWIIAFVSLIGLAFLAELALVNVDWPQAAVSWVTPSFPAGSAAIVMSVLGAVVMPHNLFLHSEVIQSVHYEQQGEKVIRERLRYELFDTLFSMGVGWAINSAMVILAATTFFTRGVVVDDLATAAATLSPILGSAATIIFAVALLLAGLSSSVTAGMAAGTISAGMFGEEYDIHDRHSSVGVALCMGVATLACLLVRDTFQGLVLSQALLSLQLPILRQLAPHQRIAACNGYRGDCNKRYFPRRIGSVVEAFALVASCLAAVGQLWFWRLHTHEQRSLWYGLSFLIAVGTAVVAIEVILLQAFSLESHPVAEQINLVVIGVMAVTLLAFPVALVVTLVASGIRLVRREGANPRNMLSLGLGILMVAYVIVWPQVRSALTSVPVLGRVLDLVFGFAAILLGIAGVAFTLYTVSGLVIPHRRRRYQRIVVLGSGLMPDGSVTPLLAHRVERGVEMWRRNPGSMLLMSGGQGADEAQPESHAMRAYAESLGVPAEAILVEDKSTNTQENLQFSSRLFAERDGGNAGRILVVTDNYHVFRALLITRELGIPADGVGSRVRLYFSLNALVREWVAYVSLRRAFYTRLTIALLVIYLVASGFNAAVAPGA